MPKEIKSINVHPSEEEATINEWQCFGWEFKSTQEVKTSDSSHLERRGDTIYNVTKAGDHYVKLTFERDPARQNYNELVSLEQQYNSVIGPGYVPRLGKIIIGLGILFLLAGFGTVGDEVSTGILMILIGGAAVTLKIMFYSKKKKQWEENFSHWSNSRAEIIAKARALA